MTVSRTRARSDAHRQHGAALFITLIMLGLMTLLAVSAFNIGSVNLKIVTNVQARQEATAAADQAAQGVIGSPAFALSPPPLTPANVDVNNDGTVDYTAAVVASCLTYKPYPVAGQILDAEDTCAGSASLPSAFCDQTLWDVQSQATPASGSAYRGNVGTDVTVHQGARIVMSLDDAPKYCQ